MRRFWTSLPRARWPLSVIAAFFVGIPCPEGEFSGSCVILSVSLAVRRQCHIFHSLLFGGGRREDFHGKQCGESSRGRSATRVHTRRASGRDCHHRHARRTAPSRGTAGPRGGPTVELPEQPQATGPRMSELSRCPEPVSTGQHRPHGLAVRPWRHRPCDWLACESAAVHGGTVALQQVRPHCECPRRDEHGCRPVRGRGESGAVSLSLPVVWRAGLRLLVIWLLRWRR